MPHEDRALAERFTSPNDTDRRREPLLPQRHPGRGERRDEPVQVLAAAKRAPPAAGNDLRIAVPIDVDQVDGLDGSGWVEGPECAPIRVPRLYRGIEATVDLVADRRRDLEIGVSIEVEELDAVDLPGPLPGGQR